MKAIAVDDEIYMLENLQEAVSASSDIEQVEKASAASMSEEALTASSRVSSI